MLTPSPEKTYVNKLLLTGVLCTLPFLQGCGVGILAAGIGYATSSNKEATAKKEQVRVKYAEAYNQYKIEMEKVNLEREKAGLQPRPIMEYAEWMAQQPMDVLRESEPQAPKKKEEKDSASL